MARPSRTILWALGLGVLLVVVGVVVAVVVRGGDHTPSEAAEEWAQAYLDGDDDRREELECEGFDEQPLAVLEVTEITMPSRLDAVRETGPTDGEWRVVLGWDDAQGQEQEITVGVREEGGAYVVC